MFSCRSRVCARRGLWADATGAVSNATPRVCVHVVESDRPGSYGPASALVLSASQSRRCAGASWTVIDRGDTSPIASYGPIAHADIRACPFSARGDTSQGSFQFRIRSVAKDIAGAEGPGQWNGTSRGSELAPAAWQGGLEKIQKFPLRTPIRFTSRVMCARYGVPLDKFGRRVTPPARARARDGVRLAAIRLRTAIVRHNLLDTGGCHETDYSVDSANSGRLRHASRDCDAGTAEGLSATTTGRSISRKAGRSMQRFRIHPRDAGIFQLLDATSPS